MAHIEKLCKHNTFAEWSKHINVRELTRTDNNDFRETFKRMTMYASKWGKRMTMYASKWGKRMRTLREHSQISCDLSLSLVEKSHYTERTTTNANLQTPKSNDLKTMSEQTPAYTSECQIFSRFFHALVYPCPICYSVMGPLEVSEIKFLQEEWELVQQT